MGGGERAPNGEHVVLAGDAAALQRLGRSKARRALARGGENIARVHVSEPHHRRRRRSPSAGGIGRWRGEEEVGELDAERGRERDGKGREIKREIKMEGESSELREIFGA